MAEPKREPRTRYIGKWMPRLEDGRLITGQGRYTDDISYPNQLHGIFVRSAHPHARILRIGSTSAKSAKGVVAVLTAEDFVASGARGVNHSANPGCLQTGLHSRRATLFQPAQLSRHAGATRYAAEPGPGADESVVPKSRS